MYIFCKRLGVSRIYENQAGIKNGSFVFLNVKYIVLKPPYKWGCQHSELNYYSNCSNTSLYGKKTNQIYQRAVVSELQYLRSGYKEKYEYIYPILGNFFTNLPYQFQFLQPQRLYLPPFCIFSFILQRIKLSKICLVFLHPEGLQVTFKHSVSQLFILM